MSLNPKYKHESVQASADRQNAAARTSKINCIFLDRLFDTKKNEGLKNAERIRVEEDLKFGKTKEGKKKNQRIVFYFFGPTL